MVSSKDILGFLKLLQSGQMKISIDELNRSVTALQQNISISSSVTSARSNQTKTAIDELNKSVTILKESFVNLNSTMSNSNTFLKEIADLNKAASKQTTAIYALTAVMAVFSFVQILIMKGIF